MFGPDPWGDGAHIGAPRARRGGRRVAVGLLRGVAAALPRDERAALDEQRRRVLDEHVQRSHRARGDEVACADARLPLLGPRRHRFDVLQAHRLGRPRQERALLRAALDERHARLGQRRREDEPRESGARSEVRDPAGAAHRLELERDERVRDVRVDGACSDR